MQQWWQQFKFSRAERNGTIVLMLGILIMLGVRLYLVYWTPELPQNDWSAFRHHIAEFEADTLIELNTATAEILQELPGIGPSMAGSILVYRDEIGGFYYAEQLLEVPGIGEAKLDGLLPFIRIDTLLAKVRPTSKPLPAKVLADTVAVKDTREDWPIKLKPGETIELNHATVDQLRRLPGIGLAYAERILAYRQRLGGFVNTAQLQEISGIGEAKYKALTPYLHLDTKVVKLLNVNTATEAELLGHPYTSKAWVQELVSHRPYTDLRSIPQDYDPRLKAYLVL